MKQKRKVYTKEFKLKAVELSNVRGNAQEVTRDLGIEGGLIWWVSMLEFYIDIYSNVVRNMSKKGNCWDNAVAKASSKH